MKRAVLFCTVFAALLFIISLEFYGAIYEYLLSFHNGSHLVFQATSVNDINNRLILSVSIAIIPFFILAVWQIGEIVLMRRKIFSIIVVVVFIAIALVLNDFRIFTTETMMDNLRGVIPYPLEKVYFGYAIFSGSFLGSASAYILLRSKN